MPPPIISSRRKARDRFLVRLSLSSEVVGFHNRKLVTQSRLLYLPKWKYAREVCDKNPMISIYCTYLRSLGCTAVYIIMTGLNATALYLIGTGLIPLHRIRFMAAIAPTDVSRSL